MVITIKINAGGSLVDSVQSFLKAYASFFELLKKEHPSIEIHIEVAID